MYRKSGNSGGNYEEDFMFNTSDRKQFISISVFLLKNQRISYLNEKTNKGQRILILSGCFTISVNTQTLISLWQRTWVIY